MNKASEMLHHVDWQTVTDILQETAVTVFCYCLGPESRGSQQCKQGAYMKVAENRGCV